MQAFFWISFRLFPTLPPAPLTAAAIDPAKAVPKLQEGAGLKQSSVTRGQEKPRQRHSLMRYSYQPASGMRCDGKRAAECAAAAAPRQLCSPGRAEPTAQE